MALLAVVGARGAAPAPRAAVFPLLAPVVSVLVTVALFYAATRFRATAEGALCLLAAVAIDAGLGALGAPPGRSPRRDATAPSSPRPRPARRRARPRRSRWLRDALWGSWPRRVLALAVRGGLRACGWGGCVYAARGAGRACTTRSSTSTTAGGCRWAAGYRLAGR